MRIVLSLVFIMHGLVHLLWFGVYWQYFTVRTVPSSTSLLNERLRIGEPGIRLVGLLWVLATVLWIIAGLALLSLAPWWETATITAALFSSLLCISDLRHAKFGLLINVVAVTLVPAIERYIWF